MAWAAFVFTGMTLVFYTGKYLIGETILYAVLFTFIVQLVLFGVFHKNILNLLLTLLVGFTIYNILYALVFFTNDPNQPWWFTGIPSVLNLT